MAHASEDSTVRNLQSIRDPLDKLGALARHVTSKAEELRVLETRLEARLEHLGTTEQNLQKLLEALRRQVAEAHPLINRLGEARNVASRKLDLSQPSTRPPAPGFDTAHVDRLQELAQQHAANLAALAYSAQGDLTEHAGQARREVLSTVAEAEDRLRQRLDELFRECDHRAGLCEQRIHEAAASGDIVARELQARVEAEMESISHHIEARFEPFTEQFNQRLERHQREAQLLLDEAHQGFHRRMHELDVAVRQSGDLLESRLGDGIVDLRSRSAALMEGVRASLQRDIEQLTLDARLALKPVLESVSQQRELAEDRLSALASSFEQQFRQRSEELSRAGEMAVRRAEETLLRRIDMLRPQAQAAAESADAFLVERLSRMVENAREIIRSHGEELASEINAARASSEQAIKSARNDLNRQVAELESLASTMVRSLEDRLAGRVDDLVRKSRRGLQAQIIEMPRRDSEQVHRIEAAQGAIADSIVGPGPIQLSLPEDPLTVRILPTTRAQRVA